MSDGCAIPPALPATLQSGVPGVRAARRRLVAAHDAGADGRVQVRPGGWVFAVRGKFGGTPAEDALTRLKTLVYGGTPVDEGEASDLLRSAGLTSVRPAPIPEGAPGVTIGQKPA